MRKMPQNTMSEDKVSLSELIDRYGLNKAELDSYKELCDRDNKEIKAQMAELDVAEYESESYIATVTESERVTVDEDAMLELLSQSGYRNLCIRTKEYVDADLLEKAIYRGDIDKETLVGLDKCKKVAHIKTLKLKRKK